MLFWEFSWGPSTLCLLFQPIPLSIPPSQALKVGSIASSFKVQFKCVESLFKNLQKCNTITLDNALYIVFAGYDLLEIRTCHLIGCFYYLLCCNIIMCKGCVKKPHLLYFLSNFLIF